MKYLPKNWWYTVVYAREEIQTMLRYFTFSIYNIDEKFIENINNCSLSIQLQSVFVLEMYGFNPTH